MMRTSRLLAAGVSMLWTACSGELPHDSPFDPNSPLEKQAKASLTGAILLEGENDHSQVSVELQNATRTYHVDTATDGSVNLTGVVPGSYTLSLRTRYFTGITETVAIDLGAATDFGRRMLSPRRGRVLGQATAARMLGGDAVEAGGVNVSIQKIASIRSAVSAAPSAFRVAAEPATGPTLRTVSGEDGSYEFGEVPAGGYRLYASTPETGEQLVGDVTVTGEGDVIVDPVMLRPLTGAFEILGNAGGRQSTQYTNTAAVKLRLTFGNAVLVKALVSEDGTKEGCDLSAATAQALPEDQLLPISLLEEGVNWVCVSYLDAVDKESAAQYGSIIFDETPPVLSSVQINGGAAVVNSSLVTLQLSAVDVTSAVASYKVSTTNTFGAQAMVFQPTAVFPLESGDGLRTVWVTIGDAAGNYADPVSATVLVDTTPPSPTSFALETLDGMVLTTGSKIARNKVLLTSTVDDLTGLELQVTTNGSYATAAWVAYEPSRLLELPSGTSSISARVRDRAGLVTDLVSGFGITVDMIPPVLTLVRSSAASSNSLSVSLSLTANEAGEAQVSEDPGFEDAPWFPLASTTLTLDAGDGLRTIYARARDGAGNISAVRTVQVRIDRTPPQLAAFTINAGAAHTNNEDLTLRFSGIEIDEVRVAEDVCAGTYAPHTGSMIFALDPGEGLRTIAVQYRDAAGNATECLTQTIRLDTESPAFAGLPITAAAAGGFARNAVLTLYLNVTGADEMRLSASDSFGGAAWTPVTSQTSWLLQGADGTKRIYGQFRDLAGNAIGPFSLAVTLDTTPPAPLTFTLEGGAEYLAPEARFTRDEEFAVAALSVNELNGWVRADIFDDAALTSLIGSFTPATTYPQTLALSAGNQADGEKKVYARIVDKAGNTAVSEGAILLDSTAPVFPSLGMGSGTTIASSRALSLVADAYDSGSGVANLEFAQDLAFSVNAVEVPFSRFPNYSLSVGTLDGQHTVYARYADAAGNADAGSTVSLAVMLDTAAPVLDSFVIEGGAALTGNTIVGLALAATDANPIGEMQLSEDPAFAGAAWIAYQESPYFILSAVQGPKTVYARVRDIAGKVSNSLSAGIALDTFPPVNLSAVIDAGAPSTNLTAAQLALSANDANSVEVRISGDLSAVAGSFANVNAWIPFAATVGITLTGGDGLKQVEVEFRDSAGNTAPGAYSDTITLDQAAPAAPVLNSVVGGHHTLTAAWTPVPGVSRYEISYAFQQGDGTPQALEGASPLIIENISGIFTLRGLPNWRDYTVSIRAIDEAGNRSAASSGSGGNGFAMYKIGSGSAVTSLGATGTAMIAAVASQSSVSIFRSVDSGVTWQPAGSFNEGQPISALVVRGTREGTSYVLAEGPGILYVSDDDGMSWVRRPLDGSVHFGMNLDIVGSDQVFICGKKNTGQTNFVYSANQGRTFTSSTLDDSTWWSWCDVSATADSVTVVYAGFFNFYASTSTAAVTGFSWWTTPVMVTQGSGTGDSYAGLVRTRDASTLLFSALGGGSRHTYRSTDQGISWTKDDEFTSNSNLGFYAWRDAQVAIDDADRLWLFDSAQAYWRDATDTGNWKRVTLPIGPSQRIAGRPAFFGLAPYFPVYDSVSGNSAVLAPALPPPAKVSFYSANNYDEAIGFAWPEVEGALYYGVAFGAAPYAFTSQQNLGSLTSGVRDLGTGGSEWNAAIAYSENGPSEYSWADYRTDLGEEQYSAVVGQGVKFDGDHRQTAYVAAEYGALSFTPDAGLTWYTPPGLDTQGGRWVVVGRGGLLYSCMWSPGSVSVYRMGATPKQVQTVFTYTTGDAIRGCAVAADGNGRVALVTRHASWSLLIHRSLDHGATFAPLAQTCAPGSMASDNFKAVYDGLGRLYTAYDHDYFDTEVHLCRVDEGVFGRTASTKTWTFPDDGISYGFLEVDAQGYVHLLTRMKMRYYRLGGYDEDELLERQFSFNGYASGLHLGPDNDVLITLTESGYEAAAVLLHSKNHGGTFERHTFPASGGNNGPAMFTFFGDTLAQTFLGNVRLGGVLPRYDRFGDFGGEPGLMGHYFNGSQFEAAADVTRDATIDFSWPTGIPAAPAAVTSANFSARWLGHVYVDFDETHTFYVSVNGSTRLWIDGNIVINQWADSAAVYSVPLTLTKGFHQLRLDYANTTGPGAIRLEYESASQPRKVIPQTKLTRFVSKSWKDMRSGPLYFHGLGGGYNTLADPVTGNTGYTALTFAPNSDNGSAAVALPFRFNYYGIDYNAVNVSSNGLLDFNSANVNAAVPQFPAGAAFGRVIAALGADLEPSSGWNSGVYTYTVGSAPWRTFVITWYNWARKGQAGDRLTFQVLLHETSNEIELNYGTLPAFTASAGVNRGNNMEGLALLPVSGQSIKLTPNADMACAKAGATACY